MRTTLDIEEDVLQAVEEIAWREKKTARQVNSALARHALTASRTTQAVRAPRPVHVFRPFPSRGGVVTNELIDSLRDDVH